jgi:hypothetical protein
LSALNVLTGHNNSGKSTLLNLLASLGQRKPLDGCPWIGDLEADISWFDPQPHTAKLQVQASGIEFLHDQELMPGLSSPYRTITVRPPRRRLSELQDWAQELDLDKHAFLRLLLDVPQSVGGEVSRVDIINGSPLVYLRSVPEPVQLDADPSNGLAGMVLFEAAIALAKEHGQSGPTLLLMDDFGDFLHPVLVHKMLKLLACNSGTFQTVVMTHHTLPSEIRKQWTVTVIGADDHDTLTEAVLAP